ncbi:fatty-acid desaturase [Terriglobus roseus DSM 18391]|uniref:Fatty-acid desaturase n=2 Tax=Terriglobus roseus TaxID=392734 RepID=I3ZH34_TERRK|nr:fatty acid desaturase [Terriglobus roseus]AFL88552.1 fatty-acid desaturase [Terriglobus roseus DSM 18391]
MSPVVDQAAAEQTRSTPVATAPVRLVPAAVEAREKAKMDLRMGREHQHGQVNWITAIAFGAFHVLAVVALFFWSWSYVACFAVMYFLAINVGIGMTYHRLLTHRGYRVPRWLEIFMTACGTMALEGGPIFWVATHRVHHQHSDQEGDPHTPHDGTWWAHIGWIITGRAMHSETALLGRYAPDLTRDPAQRWLSKYHWLPLTIAGFLQMGLGYYMGGVKMMFGMVLWGTFLRVVVGVNATWFVNSASHMFGPRRFETKDDSRNNWWVAILTGGEGWHNNHHAHPVSARHGLVWYEFDINYYGIWLLKKLGIAKKVQIAKWDPSNPKPAGA